MTRRGTWNAFTESPKEYCARLIRRGLQENDNAAAIEATEILSDDQHPFQVEARWAVASAAPYLWCDYVQ